MKRYKLFLLLFFFSLSLNKLFSQENIKVDSLKKNRPLSVITGVPTSTPKSITFNGFYMVEIPDSNLKTWFEYSTDQKMLETSKGLIVGYNKVQDNEKNVGSFTYILTEPTIQKDVIYYLRAVAENPTAGKIYGKISSIKTCTYFTSIASAKAVNITQTSAVLTGIVNPNGANTNIWFETPSGGPFQLQNLGSGTSDTTLTPYTLTGLTPNTIYTFRLKGANSNGVLSSDWVSFKTLTSQDQQPVSHTINTNSATSVSQTSAVLNATFSVSPDYVWFEYGNNQIQVSTGQGEFSSFQNTSVPADNINYSLSGLTPATTYYFRAVGMNNSGTTYGSILSFKTLANDTTAPIIVSVTATNITQTSAVLNGEINPNGVNTIAHFETPTDLPFQARQLGNGNSTVSLTASLTGLTANTNYKFRIVASNIIGDTYGNWISFTTANIKNSDTKNKDSLKIKQITSPKINNDSLNKNQIKVYNQNKVNLEKQIESFNNKIKHLISDSDYSKVDFKKIEMIKLYFEDIDRNLNKASFEEIISTNYLMNDLSTALKIIKRKRKFKKDSLIYIKYDYLFINIKALHNFMVNDLQGFNFRKNDELLCYLGKQYPILGKDNNFNYTDKENGDCGNRKGYPVEVHSILEKDSKGHNIEMHKLRVNYCYYYGHDYRSDVKKPMNNFAKLTSPSCENVIPGTYYIWLTDESTKKIKLCSNYIKLDISDEQNLDKNTPILIEILVIK